jgi:hypothetical protein
VLQGSAKPRESRLTWDLELGAVAERAVATQHLAPV